MKRNPNVYICGVGYVGFPLVMECAKSSETVYAQDLTSTRIKELASILKVNINLNSSHNLTFSWKNVNFSKSVSSNLRDYEVYIFCLPTPLSKSGNPDPSNLIKTLKIGRAHV